MTDYNALDRASFFVEELKYGPGPRNVEAAGTDVIASQLELLLREADVSSITGRELIDAAEPYAVNLAAAFRMPVILARSVFVDGLVHGIALAARLEGSKERLDELEAAS